MPRLEDGGEDDVGVALEEGVVQVQVGHLQHARVSAHLAPYPPAACTKCIMSLVTVYNTALHGMALTHLEVCGPVGGDVEDLGDDGEPTPAEAGLLSPGVGVIMFMLYVCLLLCCVSAAH